ncbi:MAG: citrate synthase/methylcitrate synthase [Methanobacteriota archaeon]|nr:MAG: citrate synthase/methylcitrate synthase [Euryarchaeota archaeon]
MVSPVKTDFAGPRIDKGLDNVYVKETSICFVDGQRGRLLYRGYDIRDLAAHSTFEETVFLLLEGRLPNREELKKTKADLAAGRTLPPFVLRLLRSMPEHMPPMDVLRTAVSYLSNFDPERDDTTRAANQRKARRLVAQFGTVVATYERIRKGHRVLRPDPKLGHAEDFLRMMSGRKPDPVRARMMDVAMILYADHAMNASTFAATVAASTRSDLYSTIIAALSTLKGPLHGGAIEAALRGMEMAATPERAEEYVLGTLRNHEVVYGFGHRVYKTYDPRALIQKEFARQLADLSGDDRLYRIATAIEETVVREIGSKGVYPNVDFYSGLVFQGLGIPTDLFTPVFAVARIAGWTAQVIEYWEDNRLLRPLDWYVGPKDLVYVSVDERP